MYVFCSQCGAQNPGDALHCSSCGAAIVNPAAAPQPAPMQTPPAQQFVAPPEQQFVPQAVQPQQPIAQPVTTTKEENKPQRTNFFKSKLFIPLVAGISSFFMLVLILILVLVLNGGNSMNKAVDRYFDALVSADAEDYMKAFPEAYREYLDDENFDIDDLQDAMDDFLEYTEDDTGKKTKARFEIVDQTEFSSSRLNDLKARLNNRYNMPRRDLTEAWEVEVEVLFSGSRDDVDFTITLVVIRYDGKWYISPDEFSDFLFYYYYYY